MMIGKQKLVALDGAVRAAGGAIKDALRGAIAMDPRLKNGLFETVRQLHSALDSTDKAIWWIDAAAAVKARQQNERAPRPVAASAKKPAFVSGKVTRNPREHQAAEVNGELFARV
jgi:hypothetical protein